MNKGQLIKKLQKNPKKYWYLDFFKERGFKRKKCKNCGKFFWTLKQGQEICNDSSCRPYEFIGSPPTKRKFGYFELWKKIKKFFEEEGHTHVKRYPVLCRWFPDLYFTIAGVVDFYRKNNSNFVFELPKNPVVVLQPSLRFNDIPQVGVSGRHWTCHSHLEQASLYNGKKGYWKERCIELDYRMLKDVLGVKPELINFTEDAWLGPGAFGYSLEYHVNGLELGNAVFTEFKGTPNNYRKMDKKLIDMGAGFDRLVWISQGTPTNYDVLWGNLTKKMKKKSGIEFDEKFFKKYSKLAGLLNLDEVEDIKKAKKEVAKKLGVSYEKLEEKIGPIQAIYAIADHIQTLLFAIADGGIPSNIGGGYNLRVILRRTLSFIEEFDFDLDLSWIAEKIANYWKPLYPELSENLENFKKIIAIEKKKYQEKKKKANKNLNRIFKRREKITEDKLINLYDSKGISPELVKKIGEKYNTQVKIPEDFYKKVTEKHEKNKTKTKKYPIEKNKLKDLEKTKKLFYDDVFEFEAKVLKIIGNFVVLEKTAFYPRSGGQENDKGKINNSKVFDVEKINGIILHKVDEINFEEEDSVKCKVNKKRRKQLTQHHTATHIINASTREVLGDHIWQGGSKKGIEKAHLDVSHYKNLSKNEIKEIEKKANKIIQKDWKVKREILDRPVAEKKYGFRIYQGAAVPSKKLRIISIDDIEHEACGGNHVNSTGEIEKIKILKTEKPHDGAVRLVYVAGKAAKEFEEKCEKILEKLEKILNSEKEEIPDEVEKLINRFKRNRKRIDKLKEKIALSKTKGLEFEKIKGREVLIKEIRANKDELKKISLEMTNKDTVIFLFGLNKKINIFASAGKEVKINIGKIVSEISRLLGGKGGGSDKLGQGFGTKKEKISEAKEKIREMIE